MRLLRLLVLLLPLSLTDQVGPLPGTGPALFAGQLSCSGGTVTSSGGNIIHTFTSSGTLTCTGLGTFNYLIVGGGGNGAG